MAQVKGCNIVWKFLDHVSSLHRNETSEQMCISAAALQTSELTRLGKNWWTHDIVATY